MGRMHSSWLFGVRDDRAFFQVEDQDGPRVEVVDPSGAVVSTIDMPSMAWPAGLTPGGRVLTQTGGRVFAVDPDGASEVAAGDLMGIVGALVLVTTCDAEMRCAVDAIDLETGARWPTPLPRGYLEVHNASTFTVHTDSDGRQAFEIRGDEFIEVDSPRDFNDFTPNAQDTSGIRATLHSDTIGFTQLRPDDTEIARIPWPATVSRSPERAIVLLTIDAPGA